MQPVTRRESWMAHLQTKCSRKSTCTPNVLLIYLLHQKQAAISVDVLPKHLDEQVAALMVEGFAGVMTKLTTHSKAITLALTSMVRSKTTVTSIEIRFSVAVNIAACAATEFILRHHSPQGRCVGSTSMQAITWRECSGSR
jgi:hypothetical protein